MKTTPRKVNWQSNEDLQCAILGAIGMSTKCISQRTGLTPCQVSYRLGKGQIKRADYRNGESDMAELVIRRAIPKTGIEVRKVLNLNKPNEAGK